MSYFDDPGSIWLCLLFLALATATPIAPRSLSDTFNGITASRNLVWQPCATGYLCAVLDVPLDYDNPTNGRARLPLIKYPASTTPAKGMVFWNPGGPGISAIDSLSDPTTLSLLLSVIGTSYDIVAVETRGVGHSIPSDNCFASSRSKRGTLDNPAPLTGEFMPYKWLRSTVNNLTALGNQCQKTIGGSKQAGPHMSTLVTVQDLISILDAYRNCPSNSGIANADLLNFWGISYGTYIGQVFASKYPNRTGRMVLDGVEDADNMRSGMNTKSAVNTDTAFSTFFVYCNLAGPSLCPYATGANITDIYHRFETLIGRLNATKANALNWSNATMITNCLEILKINLYELVYSPNFDFPYVSPLLQLYESIFLQQDITITSYSGLIQALNTNAYTTFPSDYDSLGLIATYCSDTGGVLYKKTLADLGSRITTIRGQSFIAADYLTSGLIACSQWPIKALGVFTGIFGGPTKTPILFVSNTRDPVTPLINGQKGTKLFPKSQLLTIDGTGHTTSGSLNNCAFSKIGAYLQTGALPGTSNYCPLEAGPFGIVYNDTITKRDLLVLEDVMADLRGQ